MANDVYAPPRTMLEVFKCLPEGTLIELINNNLVLWPTPHNNWHIVRNEIFCELYMYVKKQKNGVMYIGPLDTYLDERNVFQPDILFISNKRKGIIQEIGLVGAPDLIIELLQPETAKHEHGTKKDVYARSGVTEYWIINPEDNSATGYYLAGDEYHEFIKGTGQIKSKLLEWECSF